MKQMGHLSPSETLNIYAHLLKPDNQSAANRFENMIFQESGSNITANNKKRVAMYLATLDFYGRHGQI